MEERGLATMRGYHLSGEDRLRRAVISRLLCHTVVVKDEISREFGVDFDEYFAEELRRFEPFREDGLVLLERNEIRATWLGRIRRSRRIYVREASQSRCTHASGVLHRPASARSPKDLLGGLIPQAHFTTFVILLINVGLFAATELGGQYLVMAGAKSKIATARIPSSSPEESWPQRLPSPSLPPAPIGPRSHFSRRPHSHPFRTRLAPGQVEIFAFLDR